MKLFPYIGQSFSSDAIYPDQDQYMAWKWQLPKDTRQRLEHLITHLRAHVIELERQNSDMIWPRESGKPQHVNARETYDFIQSVGQNPTAEDRANPLMRNSGTWTTDHWCETVMMICWCWDAIIEAKAL